MTYVVSLDNRPLRGSKDRRYSWHHSSSTPSSRSTRSNWYPSKIWPGSTQCHTMQNWPLRLPLELEVGIRMPWWEEKGEHGFGSIRTYEYSLIVLTYRACILPKKGFWQSGKAKSYKAYCPCPNGLEVGGNECNRTGVGGNWTTPYSGFWNSPRGRNISRSRSQELYLVTKYGIPSSCSM